MRIWLALVIAPLLALADQTIAFALVGPGCERQSTAMLHAAHGLFLALAVWATVGAFRTWQETGAAAAATGDAAFVQRQFLAGVATTVAALSAAAIVAMWLPTWLISPCVG